MGRPGEFYDQDQKRRPATTSSGPARSGFGMLYDQDGEAGPAARPRPSEIRRRQLIERQREREIELRRQAERQHEREERRRALEAHTRLATPEPVRISSRPVPPVIPVVPAVPAPRTGLRSPYPGTGAAGPTVSRRRPAGERDAGRRDAGRREAGRRDGAVSTATTSRRSAPTSTQRATAVLAVGTFASRLTGFVRVLAIGYVLGVGPLSDAYNYANGIPNIVYDLLLGGILSATLIPVFVEQLNGEDREETARSISAVLTAIAAALVVMSALLWLLAPWIIHFYLLLNPASTGAPERALATRLLRYFVPQVFFLGAIVVSTALLNARRSFAAAALSPILNNLIAIAALVATKVVANHVLTAKSLSGAASLNDFSRDQHAVLILGLGTTAGYVVQFIVQLPAMRRAGFVFRLVWDLRHPAVRRVATLSSWLVGVVLANQISLALVMVLAGRTEGGVTAYQFSYQFFQLPYALIAVSVASALMPDLAQRWTSRDVRGFERQFVRGLRITLALLVPAGLAYVAVAQPFIQLAIHHGRVTASGAHLVSSSLALFAVGLPGFAAFFLLMRVYQAMQDARAMFWIYALENLLTVIAALVLDPLLGVPGLALAWVAPYTIASLVAVRNLRRRVGPLGGGQTVQALVRIVIASGISLGVVVLLGLPFPTHAGDAVLIGRLIVQLGLGGLVYLAVARRMGVKELKPVIGMVRQGLNRL